MPQQCLVSHFSLLSLFRSQMLGLGKLIFGSITSRFVVCFMGVFGLLGVRERVNKERNRRE